MLSAYPPGLVQKVHSRGIKTFIYPVSQFLENTSCCFRVGGSYSSAPVMTENLLNQCSSACIFLLTDNLKSLSDGHWLSCTLHVTSLCSQLLRVTYRKCMGKKAMYTVADPTFLFLSKTLTPLLVFVHISVQRAPIAYIAIKKGFFVCKMAPYTLRFFHKKDRNIICK